MNNFASIFNIAPEDLVKSKAKNKDSAKKSKGVTEAKPKNIRYPMPVRVRCGHIVCNFTKAEFDGATLDEKTIKITLREKFPELSSTQFNLVKFSNNFTEMLENLERESMISDSLESEEQVSGDDVDFAAAEQSDQEDDMEGENSDSDGNNKDIAYTRGCWIKLEVIYQPVEEKQIAFPVSIKVGEISCEIEEEKSIKDIGDYWKGMHPEYAVCNFAYDERNHYLLPYITGESVIKGKSYPLPIKVGYLNTIVEFSREDFCGKDKAEATWDEIKRLYAKQFPEYDNSTYCYIEEENILVPVLDFKRTEDSAKIAIPVTIRIVAGCMVTLSVEDMHGKESATLEEIRNTLEEQYPEYSKERTEMLYDERGFVIPVIHGSKKGIEIIYDRAGYKFCTFHGADGYKYRKEDFPYGSFCCREDGEDVSFGLTAKKIPKALLDEIVLFFERVPEKEAAVQIFYCVEDESYKIVVPKQEATKNSVFFERNPQLESRWTLVMDVHSHGYYPAFFSLIDDNDEKGTRLFMVIGNMNKAEHSYKLRAGIIGKYMLLELQDVFA